MSFKLTLSLISLIIATNLSMAQKPPMKFGKIDIENLKMTHYEKDSSASAVVLCDYGTASIEYSTILGFQVIYIHHIRIKIFNTSAYKHADGIVYLYHNSGNSEKISHLKGVTYNLDGDKIVESKLNKKAVFEENYNDNNNVKKFTMPNVKEGSIIEYSYKITSDFAYNFQSWEFQKMIPVIWSEFRSSVPEYYNYEKLSQGYLGYYINSSSTKDVTKSYMTKAGSKPSNLTYTVHNNRWVIKDAPAYVTEPFITTSKNYISKIIFEISSTKFPNSLTTRYMGTWDLLNTKLLKHESFGMKIEGSSFLKKKVDEITKDETDLNVKLKIIYDFVKSNIEWNEETDKYVKTNFRKILEEKKGNSADINLLLTSMLKKSGISADPVILSTRSNGIVRDFIPLRTQFNYVICQVTIGDKPILIDATDRYLPMDMLPQRCLNGKGWVVSKMFSGWTDIIASKISKKQMYGEFNIENDATLSGTLTLNYSGYEAKNKRKRCIDEGDEKYISDRIDNSKWEIEELALENSKELSKPFVEKHTIEEMSAGENLGNKIYLNPIVVEAWSDNPLKLKNREYPIDFGYHWGEKYYVTFTIPDGLEVEEMPTPLAIGLPNGGGKFLYKVSVIGNKITVLNTINVKKTMFVQAEYAYIKEFFAQIVAKHKEQIILKKI